MKNHNPRKLRLSPMEISPSSAAPIDHLELLVIGFICLIGLALAWRIQASYSPPLWVHLFIALPTVLMACLLRLLNGWLTSDTKALVINRK